jgi:hypothetical protein
MNYKPISQLYRFIWAKLSSSSGDVFCADDELNIHNGRKVTSKQIHSFQVIIGRKSKWKKTVSAIRLKEGGKWGYRLRIIDR